MFRKDWSDIHFFRGLHSLTSPGGVLVEIRFHLHASLTEDFLLVYGLQHSVFYRGITLPLKGGSQNLCFNLT